MAAVTICSDFVVQKKTFDTVSTVSPSISHEVINQSSIQQIKFLNILYLVEDLFWKNY